METKKTFRYHPFNGLVLACGNFTARGGERGGGQKINPGLGGANHLHLVATGYSPINIFWPFFGQP